MSILQWSGFAVTPPTLSAPLAGANANSSATAAVGGVAGARRVTAAINCQQIDLTGTTSANASISFSEDFKIIPPGEDFPLLMIALVFVSGLAVTYADESLGAIPFIFPPLLPTRNTALGRITAGIDAKIFDTTDLTNPVIALFQPITQSDSGSLIADETRAPLNLVAPGFTNADPSRTYRLVVRLDLNASASVTVSFNNPTTTEARAELDLNTAAFGVTTNVFVAP